MRRHVIAQFSQNPGSFATAALAELLLLKPDADVEKLLRDGTLAVRYDIASQFKLVAALSRPERVVEALENVLDNIPLSLDDLHLPRWVDRAPQRGVGARGRPRSPAGLAGYVRRPRRAA